jgi:UDP-N-acetylglucosamine 1-carboxyvinyltransferase
VNMTVNVDNVVIRHHEGKLVGTDIQTLPYPGFATDLQQPLTPLLTQAVGESVVKETIYIERFKHCVELQRMGADIQMIPASAIINGPTQLFGDRVTATDLRCGASLVIAGLIADGVTEIHNVHHIDRGYENLDGKLKALGADIWRETIE